MKTIKVLLVTAMILCTSLMSGYTFTNSIDLEEQKEALLIKDRIETRLNSEDVATVSEYDLYLDLVEKTDSELREAGYTTDQIKSLREFDYSEEIEKKAQLDEKELKSLGYSSDRIDAIKSFDGTEASIRSGSAQLTFVLYEENSYSSSNFSFVDLGVYWTWDSTPLWGFTDIIAVSWSDGMYCDTSNTNNTREWFYWHREIDDVYMDYSTKELTAELNAGAYVREKISKNTGSVWNPKPEDFHYLKNGAMLLRIHKQAYVPEIAVLAKYGHSTITISPSVTFSQSPAIGISFSMTMQEAGEDDLYVNLNN
ncbi:hypothetical protein RBH29_12375 [Herbivorax sp. ANBcel31]|uniref:hypothetical protein n=1 Tax=Herbivorax sp. ANBcel31 TaxID=3069754 RepID=UPI0027B3B54D|nr:hypothetical protein [Herbivorax sp. ANBcel31]MDQ2087223.1 hypothetical protein [Herbivorax sp. ANBcel31]